MQVADLEDAVLPLHVSYGQEIAKLKMQLLLYREALIENGIDPPDGEGEDLMRMWESCKAVIKAAQGALAELGTSKELLYPMARR